jgi:hypothetical protein
VNNTLHVVTELNPDALTIAAELDAERKNGTSRGYMKLSYHEEPFHADFDQASPWHSHSDQEQHCDSRQDEQHSRLMGIGRCQSATRQCNSA